VQPGSVIGYLIQDLAGEYDTPFSKTVRNGNIAFQGISHISLYVATPIPVPAAGFLLIGALGGLALLRRRQQKLA